MKLKTKVLLALILGCAAALRFWGLRWGLPYEYQSEEYKVVKYALRMGSGDLNPHFFEYPSLYLYWMLALDGLYFVGGKIFGLFHSTHDFALAFVRDPSCFYLLGRISEALAGIFLVYLVFLIGKRMFSHRTGLFAAAIFAALPNFIYMSHIVKGYMGMTALLLLFFLACLEIADFGKPRHYVFAGILMGLAVSTRYHAAPFGIVLPLAHLLWTAKQDASARRAWTTHRVFLLSLILIPIAFFLTTPYALLARTEFWRDVGGNVAIYGSLAGERHTLLQGMATAADHFLTFGDVPAPIALGFVCAAGFALAFLRWQRSYFLILAPIAAYLLVVGSYHHQAGGYLLQVFPLFALLGVHGWLELPNAFGKRLGAVLLVLGAAWNGLFGAQMAYSFTVPDTRTAAKEWIEANVPPGSRILLDNKAQAPQLLTDYGQLKKFYEAAVAENHFKKEYFALQMEAHPGPGKGYKIFLIRKSFRQIASLEHQVEETQKLQDLVDVDGNLRRLRKAGIQYVVVNHWSKEDALRRETPGLADFYKALEEKAEPLKTFTPAYRIYHGGIITVYQL